MTPLESRALALYDMAYIVASSDNQTFLALADAGLAQRWTLPGTKNKSIWASTGGGFQFAKSISHMRTVR